MRLHIYQEYYAHWLESAEKLAILKRFRIAGVTLAYIEADFSVPIAIAVGTEQLGLSAVWMSRADCQVRISMHGVADSLNVASATTFLLYEVVRQRSLRR